MRPHPRQRLIRMFRLENDNKSGEGLNRISIQGASLMCMHSHTAEIMRVLSTSSPHITCPTTVTSGRYNTSNVSISGAYNVSAAAAPRRYDLPVIATHGNYNTSAVAAHSRYDLPVTAIPGVQHLLRGHAPAVRPVRSGQASEIRSLGRNHARDV